MAPNSDEEFYDFEDDFKASAKVGKKLKTYADRPRVRIDWDQAEEDLRESRLDIANRKKPKVRSTS